MDPKITECAICMERFKDPQILPCGHTFCKGCLEQLVGKVRSLSLPELILIFCFLFISFSLSLSSRIKIFVIKSLSLSLSLLPPFSHFLIVRSHKFLFFFRALRAQLHVRAIARCILFPPMVWLVSTPLSPRALSFILSTLALYIRLSLPFSFSLSPFTLSLSLFHLSLSLLQHSSPTFLSCVLLEFIFAPSSLTREICIYRLPYQLPLA